jgi:hypothetical protein
MRPVRRRFATLRGAVLGSLLLLLLTTTVVGQTVNPFPGGWIEKQGTATRARYTASQIQSFVPPIRGAFSFPAPYSTRAIRITDASDCGGTDCVNSIGYSYWRNTNAHENSGDMWIFVGLSTAKGGSGPTLFKLNKATDAITKVGPLFPGGSPFRSASGDTWYFSASRPNKLYINDGPKLLRYDVVTQVFDTVFDITAQYGSGRYVWQIHSSNDDLVHSATLRLSATNEDLGCFVFNETTRQFSFFGKVGTYDECHIDKSGRYLMIQENTDGLYGLENVFIDLQSGSQSVVLDQNGGLGHADLGYGYAVGMDNWNSMPGAAITFTLASIIKGPTVFYSNNWNMNPVNHVSHLNAKPVVPMTQQFACGSNADYGSTQNEVVCFRLDSSHDQLIVAPVMTDMNAPGGGSEYAKYPKGNLDISGRYFVWTSNMGGNRLDAFLVKIPSQLLVGSGDTIAPAAPVNLRLTTGP